MRLYAPLRHDHPLIGAARCPTCREVFKKNGVTTLRPIDPTATGTVEALPHHARCVGATDADIYDEGYLSGQNYGSK